MYVFTLKWHFRYVSTKQTIFVYVYVEIEIVIYYIIFVSACIAYEVVKVTVILKCLLK